jgi:hypothetical protein
MKSRRRGLAPVEFLVLIVIITFFLSLAAALVPSIDRAEESAKRALCANQLRQIGAAIAVYADSFNGYLPWYGGNDPAFKSADPADGSKPFNCKVGSVNCPIDDEIHPFNAYRDAPAQWKFPDGTCRPFRLGCLYASGIVEDAGLFYCPSEQDPLYRYESYLNPIDPNAPKKWGILPQWINTAMSGVSGFGNQYVRTGYTYYPISEKIPKSLVPGYMYPMYTVRTFDQMDTTMPYLTDRICKRNPQEVTDHKPKPIAHRTGDFYAVNALFKDGHIFYCENQDVFNSEIYDQFEETRIDYRTFYYNTFKAIGNCSRGEEPFIHIH